jgi:hypothetical protein
MRIFLLSFLIFISSYAFTQDVKKGKLIYENNFASEKNLADWIMEGQGKIEFVNNVMEMYSPNEEGHHVFWCPNDFPKDFIAEWDAKNFETDAGLCIIFFAAKGLNGQSIFDSSMPKRTTGVFTDYTKGALNCYHISYYANAKDDAHRETANLRKNKGFNLVLTGEKGISMESTSWNHMKLVKLNNQITFSWFVVFAPYWNVECILFIKNLKLFFEYKKDLVNPILSFIVYFLFLITMRRSRILNFF